MSQLEGADADVWLPKLSLRKQLALLWCMSRGHSVEQMCDLADVARETVQVLYRRFVLLVAEHQQTANDTQKVGGCGVQYEADEVAFRCKAERDGTGLLKILWIRYFGLVRRGSSKVLLALLPDRLVRGSGQGGGGCLRIEELSHALRADSTAPLLKEGSVLHTDSAKAYRKVGPQAWPAAGALQSNSHGAEPFSKHRWTHTNVTHKRKTGVPLRYVIKSEVVLPDGERLLVLKGTQKIDGYWASLRRLVGKLSVETGHSSYAARRGWLRALVCAHQWRWLIVSGSAYDHRLS